MESRPWRRTTSCTSASASRRADRRARGLGRRHLGASSCAAARIDRRAGGRRIGTPSSAGACRCRRVRRATHRARPGRVPADDSACRAPAILERISQRDATMGTTSMRALIWRSRSPSGGRTRGAGCSWRPARPRPSTSCSIRASQNAPMTAIAVAALVIGAALTVSVPLAIALIAMPGLFIVQRVGLGGRRPLGVGCRARCGVRNRRAARPAPFQQTAAAAAVAEPRLPVHDALHGDRESVPGEHRRVVPRVAARLGRAHRRLGARRARAMRGSHFAPHVGAALRARGRSRSSRA